MVPAISRQSSSKPSSVSRPSQSWLRSQGMAGRCHSIQARWLPDGLSTA